MTNLLYPTTNLQAIEQVKFARGEGVYLYDDKGKQYLEGLAGLWCTSLGYGNKELIEAINSQLETLSYSHMFGGKTHQIGIDLADKLAEIVPVKNAKVFFGNSGSDANDSLVKMVRYYNQARGKPEKRKIIARQHAYHGVTVAAASLTGLAVNHTNFDLPFDALGVLRVDAPDYYNNALQDESEQAFCERLAKQLEDLILQEGPDTVAAFIAEPVNGAGGVIVPPQGYFQKVQAILKKYDILFLDDEVICAFGRTGNDFGATTFDFQPDAMTLAKALSSAYFPISASVVSGDIYAAIEEASSKVGAFGHGYTYSGHPVGCAAALKTIEIYQRDKLYEKATDTGKYLHFKLNEAFADHPLVGEIRGVGLIAALQFVANKESRAAFADNSVAMYCQTMCEENGLILRPLANNTMAICPPLIIDKNQIDELIDKLKLSVAQTLEYVNKKRLFT